MCPMTSSPGRVDVASAGPRNLGFATRDQERWQGTGAVAHERGPSSSFSITADKLASQSIKAGPLQPGAIDHDAFDARHVADIVERIFRN